MDDVLLNKAAIIERCLRRAKSEYAACPELDNYTHTDAGSHIVLVISFLIITL